MKRILCCAAIGMGLLIGSPASASVPDGGDPVVDSFAQWLASTAGREVMSNLTHLACVMEVDGSAYCYGLAAEGWSNAFWSPDPAQGEWIPAGDRPIANEDRPRPSDDVTAADYLDAWIRPPLDSVTLFARDDDAPSTQVVGNYGIAWDPEWADSTDGWERVQGFAEATGCDLPTDPPIFAREWYC